ncbi:MULTISPECIES: hypothetical protein [Pseudoalteromonas]|uniref:hypothetical protein n=1 Tax=Pseudoalteromonas TaxID=53246 RepID=UPI0013FD6BC6|nr:MULTISPECIES: hypothetical protein [Pseudoalteromonas]MBB1276921.1 hypothetical protein [Pseudoalteromonas sp. SR43-3]MBB1328738.1 hypothetical protein [Pseudoalteromonas sp. SR43-7]|tara:strand:- start:2056 stop:2583 length:528 start_codon:yes stop_codon:yes gene_type:complete
MSQYKPGETSTEVINKKNDITKSILKKANLIDAIKCIDDVYTSLNIKGYSIAESAVHKWSDDELGIVSYSWNTAHTKHNAQALKKLQAAIKNVNKRLAGGQKECKKRRQYESTDDTTVQLRKENEELKNSLAEVYRAYMHLIESYREDKVIDDAIRKLILDQAHILGKQRIWDVK